MTLREELLVEHSKSHALYLANKIGPSQEAFDELIKLFLANEYRVTQRAAWVVSLCEEAYPFLLDKHLFTIVENLQNPVHDAVKRNTLRILQHVELPEELMGITADICFNFLNSSREPIAIKVFSMTILYNITRKFPDLKEELRISIQDQLQYASPGILSRAKKILKELKKM